MFRFLTTTLRASAIAIPALLATSIAIPAAAQFSVSIGYDDFHSRLAPYGTWGHNARWGDVWHPTRVERNFRPYYNGRWEDTSEYGWTWVSDESWGDIPYHYGRWVFDPRDGWLWVPGYVWAPSWVVWRSGGGNIGWFPMPPDDNYYGDGAYRDNFDNQYGYRDWYGPNFSTDQFLSLWVFVGQEHFRDRDFRNYALPQRDYGRVVSQTTNTTNYITINNYVVNRSIDDNRLQRETNQRFQPVPASSVIGTTALVTQASAGRQVEQRERQKRPIPVNINPAEQRGQNNVNSNVRQPDPVQAPQNTQGRGRIRNQGGNDAGQPAPQTERVAPVVSAPRPNGNQAPQAVQERRGNRNQGGNDAGQVNPQTDRATAAPIAPGAPVANAQRQNGNQAPQDAQERRANQNTEGNPAARAIPQAERGAAAGQAKPESPITKGPAPIGDAVPQGLAERRDRDQPNPQTGRAQSFQSPQARGAERNGNAIAQDSKTPPRAQRNDPATAAATGGDGNGRNNEARGNRQTDPKDAAEKKKNGAERGPN